MKNTPIKAVLFDLDGTLLYTLEDIKASVNVPLENRGLKPISVEECREIVGHGLRDAVETSFSRREYKADKEEVDQALLELQIYYRENPTKYCKPYDNINEFLLKLNIPFGLLSNKDDKIVKQIVPEVFEGISFDYVCGAKNGILKPNKLRIIEFCEEFNLDSSEVLYVGDSEVDYRTAINANAQVALVTWGYRDKEELEKFGVPMADTIDQLWRIINAT
jgi:phosphoglycolate phosphatase